jgi:hypothetical protein
MTHPIDAHALPGIGPLRRTRLAEAGIATLEDLLAASASDLAGLPGFSASVVDRARVAAGAVLAGAAPPLVPHLVELVPNHDDEDAGAQAEAPAERPRPRLQRGLDVARRVEAALEWVGRARDHARSLPKGKPRKRLRKQLLRLASAFEAVQKEAIARGASAGATVELQALIERIESELRRWVALTPSEADARQLRRSARSARRELESRIQ